MTRSTQMSSEDRQKARAELLEQVNKAEAEFFAADKASDEQGAKAEECRAERARKREVLIRAQHLLSGFLIDPDRDAS